jgi:hypothetical protein
VATMEQPFNDVTISGWGVRGGGAVNIMTPNPAVSMTPSTAGEDSLPPPPQQEATGLRISAGKAGEMRPMGER